MKESVAMSLQLLLEHLFTIHKSQGMPIPNKIFKYVIIHIASDTMKKTPGVELIALSIAMNHSCFCLGNFPLNFYFLSFTKIDTSPVYTKRRTFTKQIILKDLLMSTS